MGGFLNKLKKLTSGLNQFTDLIPVLDFMEQEELFILDGGYIAFGVICDPTNGVNGETRQIISSLYKMEYPKGTFVQYILAALPDIGWFNKGYQELRGSRYPGNKETQGLADTMSRGVLEYYNDSVKNPLHKATGQKVRDFENWYIVKMPIKGQLPSDNEVKIALKIKEEVYGALAKISPAIAMMNESHYVHRMNVLLSVQDNAQWRKGIQDLKLDYNYPLNKQVIEPASKVEFGEDCVQIGDRTPDGKNIAICTIKSFPERIAYGQALDLVGDWLGGSTSIKESFMLSLHIHLDDKKKELSEFNRKRNMVHLGTNGGLGKKFEKAMHQRVDFDAINSELSQENSRHVQAYLQLMIMGNTKQETDDCFSEIKAYYETKKFEIIREKYICGPMFLSQLPFGLDKGSVDFFDRYQTYTAKTLSFLTPHIANWKGNTRNTVVPLVTRLGQLFSLDLFKTNGSFNCLIAAASGSGKSFLANNMIESYLGSGVVEHGTLDLDTKKVLPEDGSQVFVIDVGRSYEPLASQYEGSMFIEFGEGMGFSMDPFRQLDSDAVEEHKSEDGNTEVDEKGSQKATQIIMIHNMLKAMASESGNIEDYQSALMLHVLTEMVLELGDKGSITEFSNRCIAHEERELKKIGYQLKPFCDGGAYGNFFTKHLPPVDFSANLVVCELEELKSLPHLQKIILMTIINAAQHSFFLSGNDRRKQFFLDEAWEFLKDDPNGGQNFFATFLESGWRRFRKTNACGVCVTQSVLDGYQSAAGRAIVNNSPWKILLAQEPETIDNLRDEKAFDATEVDFQLLKNVHTLKGVYSEMYIRLGGRREICRFYADRRKQLLYSTDPIDKNKIKRYRDEGYTFGQAIDRVILDEKV